MNVYDHITTLAAAIVADTTVEDYCVDNFEKGLLVAIDDDSEKMLGSDDAPYCLLMPMPGADDSPVAEAGLNNIRIEVGTIPTGEPPYLTETTERTATANGLQKFGQGEVAVDLLELVMDAVKAASLSGGCTMLTNTTIDASGALLFPLALAVSTIVISENKDLSTFE